MNTTKKIYFLAAFVLIIGCFALNLSYSLFVQTEEKEIVSATIPKISYTLEVDGNPAPSTYSSNDYNVYNSATIEANSERIVILKVINNGNIDINYGISVVDPQGTTIKLADIDDNEILNTLEASTDGTFSSKEVWVHVTNPSSEAIDITFSLKGTYSTINLDKDGTFIANSNIDCVNRHQVLLKTYLLNHDYRVTKNEGAPTFTGTETEEVGMYSAEDDYGTSWYFRGKQPYNHVKFAGFPWRIVRTNGDGSIRLILDASLQYATKEGESEPVSKNPKLIALGIGYGRGAFNSNINDNAGVGYMYGNIPSSSYDDAHQNINSSEAKTYLETFYEEYISNYQNYLSDTLFCGDKTTSTDGTNNSSHLGYEQNHTNYAAHERLIYNVGVSGEATPSLECAKGATNAYSRYTSKIDMTTKTSKEVEVNNDLEYPIALLSADEAVMAGAYTGKPNNLYYLYDAYANGKSSSQNWTMSPFSFILGEDYPVSARMVLIVFNSSSLTGAYSNNHGYRPVINLNPNVLISSGNGTYETPYKIKLSEE